MGLEAFRLVLLLVRIPLGHGCLSLVECCVLSGRGLCESPITHPEEFYKVWCVSVWSWILDNGEI